MEMGIDFAFEERVTEEADGEFCDYYGDSDRGNKKHAKQLKIEDVFD